MLTEVTKKSIRTSDLQEEVWSQNLPNTKNEFTMTMLSPLRRTAKRWRHVCNLKVHKSPTTETECTGVHHHFPTDARKRTNDCLIPTVNRVTQSAHSYRGKPPFQQASTRVVDTSKVLTQELLTFVLPTAENGHLALLRVLKSDKLQ